MGYDFEALEDGEITATLNSHDGVSHENQTFHVKKGVKYTWDYSGVDVRER